MASSVGDDTQVMIENGQIVSASPATGEPLEPVAITDPESVAALIDGMRSAQRTHASRSLSERARLLRRFKDALLSRGDKLAETIVEETGKPVAEAWLFEVVPTADLAGYWCEEGMELLANKAPELDALSYPGKRALIERLPRGVVGLITPWNLPMAIPLRTLFPALLAGNAVLFKPSEHTPRTGAIIAEAAREVFGPHLVELVQGGAEVGKSVVTSSVDAVVFTGGVSTGRAIAASCAERLVPVSLELGGNDPAIVLEDADVERSARGLVWAAAGMTGQNCAAVERVYAVGGIAESLASRAAALVKELEPGRDFGPLMTAAQLERVKRHVDEAVAAGAKVLAGGKPIEREGYWFMPTVLTNVPDDQALIQDETFGPVLPINEVKSAEEAIEKANASRFGLNASVWTKDLKRGEELATKLVAGVVLVNNHAFTGAVPSLPWSGVGESGSGVTSSAYCLSTLTRPRALIIDGRRAKRELWWFPYTEGLSELAQRMSVLRGGDLLAKPLAAAGLVGALLKRWKTD